MAKTDFVIDKEKLEVRMTRIFEAPRELVWKAYTDPNLVPQWWGPRNLTTKVDKMEVNVGGVWRFIHHDKDGKEYAFNGVFKEIKEPELITWTFNFEPIGPGHELVETVRLEVVEGGRTKVSTVSHYKTIEDLEGMAASGMESGARETWDRLAELVEKMK